jgi:hypothetical protein
MRFGISYHIREQVLGGLSVQNQEKFDIYKERFEKGEPILGKNFEFVPGMILTREYNGRKHSIKFLADGRVEYNRQVYKSLSAVAAQSLGFVGTVKNFFTQQGGKNDNTLRYLY